MSQDAIPQLLDAGLLQDMKHSTIEYKKDTIIVPPELSLKHIYRVVKGLVIVYTSHRDDKNTHLIYGKDELFPLVAVSDKPRKGLYYAALSDCVVEQYSLTAFRKRLSTDPVFSYATLCEVITQFMLFKARVDNLEYQYASERLAYKILMLSHQFGKHTKSGVQLQLPSLTNQDIANTINLTRESVNRELAKFIKTGLVTVDNNRITIINEKGLRQQVTRYPQDLYLDNI
jgi:CRP/FNR family transcriptional regulator